MENKRGSSYSSVSREHRGGSITQQQRAPWRQHNSAAESTMARTPKKQPPLENLSKYVDFGMRVAKEGIGIEDCMKRSQEEETGHPCCRIVHRALARSTRRNIICSLPRSCDRIEGACARTVHWAQHYLLTAQAVRPHKEGMRPHDSSTRKIKRGLEVEFPTPSPRPSLLEGPN